MSGNENSMVKVARIAVIVTASLLALSFIFFAVFVYIDGKHMLSSEQISENLETISDKGYSYAASYVSDLGIKNFNQTKFKVIEAHFNAYYVYEMKDPLTLAKDTVSLFLGYFYDSTDLEDADEVTDALLTCYAYATGDTYAYYRNKSEAEMHGADTSGSFYGIGVTMQTAPDGSVTIIDVTENGPAEKAGIKSGDMMLKVDGIDVTTLSTDEVVNSVRGKDGTAVVITVGRGDEVIDYTVTRGYVEPKTVEYEIIGDGKIGYIKITTFNTSTVNQFAEALSSVKSEGVEGIIFDLRDNLGGLVYSAVEMLSYIVPEGTDIISFQINGYQRTVYQSMGYSTLDVPIVVLCNESTASISSLFTAAMRDYNDMGLLDATVIGKTTHPKGVMQKEFPLTDGSSILITVSRFFPPCGVNFDGVGVEPDIEMDDNAELIDKAVEHLTSALSNGNAA